MPGKRKYSSRTSHGGMGSTRRRLSYGGHVRRYKRRPSFKSKRGKAITNKLTALGVMEKQIDAIEPSSLPYPVEEHFPVVEWQSNGQATTAAQIAELDRTRFYGLCLQLGDRTTITAITPHATTLNPPYSVTGNTNQYGLGLWVLHKEKNQASEMKVDEFKGKEIYAKNVNLRLRIKILREAIEMPAPPSNGPAEFNASNMTASMLDWLRAGCIMQYRYIRVKEKTFAAQRDAPLIDKDLFLDWDGQSFGTKQDLRYIKTDRLFHAPIQKKKYHVLEHKYFELQAPQSVMATWYKMAGTNIGTYVDREYNAAYPTVTDDSNQAINTVTTQNDFQLTPIQKPTRKSEKVFKYAWKFNKNMEMSKLTDNEAVILPYHVKKHTGSWDYYVPERNDLMKSKIIIFARPKGVAEQDYKAFWNSSIRPKCSINWEGNQTYVDA